MFEQQNPWFRPHFGHKTDRRPSGHATRSGWTPCCGICCSSCRASDQVTAVIRKVKVTAVATRPGASQYPWLTAIYLSIYLSEIWTCLIPKINWWFGLILGSNKSACKTVLKVSNRHECGQLCLSLSRLPLNFGGNKQQKRVQITRANPKQFRQHMKGDKWRERPKEPDTASNTRADTSWERTEDPSHCLGKNTYVQLGSTKSMDINGRFGSDPWQGI